MGEYVAVEINALSQEITDTNTILKKRIDAAKECVSALQDYCNETQLKGAAYANSKMYYLSTYIPLLNQIISACIEIISLNNTIVPTFKRLVPDTQGFKADTQIIENKIKELRNDNLRYQNKIVDYRYRMNSLFSPDYSGIISWYENQIDTNNNVIIPPLEAIAEGLRTFNSACAGIYDGVASKIQRLATIIGALGSAFSWNNLENRFLIPPSVVKEIKMMEIELLSQLGESDETDIEIVNTLFPDWNRQLEEVINSPFGVSKTISDEIVIPFPNESSITYRISAKVNTSAASVVDIDHNVINQSVTLNCNGYTFTENGFSIPMISSGIDPAKTTFSGGLEIDRLGRPVLRANYSTTTKTDNFSLTSSIIMKQTLNNPTSRSVPSAAPIEKPVSVPWFNNAREWASDGLETVGNIIAEHPVESALVACLAVVAFIEPTPLGEAALAAVLPAISLGL